MGCPSSVIAQRINLKLHVLPLVQSTIGFGKPCHSGRLRELSFLRWQVSMSLPVVDGFNSIFPIFFCAFLKSWSYKLPDYFAWQRLLTTEITCQNYKEVLPLLLWVIESNTCPTCEFGGNPRKPVSIQSHLLTSEEPSSENDASPK